MNTLRHIPAVFFALALAFASSLAPAQSLKVLAERHIASIEPGSAAVGVFVADADTGEVLIAINADRPLIPASNMKLVTTAAALGTLGERFAFTTRLRRVGNNLVVVGDGDPGFGDPEILEPLGLDPEMLLDRWTDAVVRTGVKQFDTLIVDDRAFDRQFVHPAWPTNQLHKWYCAQIAGINFNDNCLDVYARPGRPGERPAVWFSPRLAPVEIDNTATTGNENALWLSRRLDSNRLVVRGTVKHELREPAPVTVHDPPMFFAETLRRRLREKGVAVTHLRRAGEQELLDGGELLAMVQTDLPVAVTRCNRDSQNLFAEALFKRMGRRVSGEPASWANGAAAVRTYLSRSIGPDAAEAVVDDGSGMSRSNRVSPKLLGRLLIHMHADETLGPLFVASLARPGDEGTLRKRFPGVELVGEVHAKSGYLDGVICLSGYVVHGERTAVFSILVNDYHKGAYRVYRMSEQIVADLDKHMAKQAPDPVKLGG